MAIYRGKGSKRAQAALDGRIAAIYGRLAAGRRIDVLDIGRVFGAARLAHERGEDLEAAVAEAVAKWTEAS